MHARTGCLAQQEGGASLPKARGGAKPAPRPAACSTAGMKLAGFFLLGCLAMAAYVALLVWNTRLYVSTKGAGQAVFLHLARTAGTACALVGFALAGARPFFAALAGFACVHAAASAMRRVA